MKKLDDYNIIRNEDAAEFDKTDIYNKEIAPLKDQIAKICALNGIPFFFSCAPKNMKGKTTYYEDGHLTGSNKIDLYEDFFKKYILVRRLKLVPATRFTDFDEAALGPEGMSYLNSQIENIGDIELE